MEQFAKSLMQCKSFKERQQNLNDAVDHLSFQYSHLFIQFHREMKRREMEYNDLSKITKWLSTSQFNSYFKLHEALLLVRTNNIEAKETYLFNLKLMLNQTIENGSNIEAALKICGLIEKSPHLSTIYESLKHLIQKVNQMKYNKHNYRSGNMKWNDHIESTVINDFEQSKIQNTQQQTPIWPTMMQPTSSKSSHCVPYFSLNCFGYDNFEMFATTNNQPAFNFSQTHFNLTIVSQDMDGAFIKWLHYLKLHKYQWFFNSLSYLEIECIDEDNIEGFISKVKISTITKGAQKKICISIKALRDRQQKFKDLILALDLEVTLNELCEYMTYMRDILHCPIPNKNCVVGDELQQDIVLIMEKSLNQVLEKLRATRFLVAHSLLGTTINKFLECSLLIMGNQTFMRNQVEKTRMLAEALKCKVNNVKRNFN